MIIRMMSIKNNKKIHEGTRKKDWIGIIKERRREINERKMLEWNF
jgi:hypothetical protein